MIEENAAGFAGITELDVRAEGCVEFCFVLLQAVEDFLVVGNVKASINLLFLGVDVETDIVRRCAKAEVVPVAGLRLTEIEFFLEIRIVAQAVIEGLPEFEF